MRSPAVRAATMEQRAGPSGTDTGLVDMLCVSLREHEGGYMHALTTMFVLSCKHPGTPANRLWLQQPILVAKYVALSTGTTNSYSALFLEHYTAIFACRQATYDLAAPLILAC